MYSLLTLTTITLLLSARFVKNSPRYAFTRAPKVRRWINEIARTILFTSAACGLPIAQLLVMRRKGQLTSSAHGLKTLLTLQLLAMRFSPAQLALAISPGNWRGKKCASRFF